jgi:hypothetical protein
MVFERLFTPGEAMKTLPLVRRIVADILAEAQSIRELDAADPGRPVAVARLEEYLAELEAMGCYYKDWSYTVGLVDFPAEIDGQTVFLCWRSDEDELGWYHGVDEGYQGRKALGPESSGEQSGAPGPGSG